MRTRFECVIWQTPTAAVASLQDASAPCTAADFAKLYAIVESAFAEIQEVEARLSPFLQGSQISRINRHAHERPVAIDHQTFSLLMLSQSLHAATGGAFDLTIGPLMRAWGFRSEGAQGSAEGRQGHATMDLEKNFVVGMGKLFLDTASESVSFTRPGVSLDMGAIGKGHALDLAVAVLESAGITNAIIHAGTSSIRTIGNDFEFSSHPQNPQWLLGNPARPRPWRIAIQGELDDSKTNHACVIDPLEVCNDSTQESKQVLGAAIGVSAQRGRTLKPHQSEAKPASIGHIMDPRTGLPAESRVLTAAVTIPTQKFDSTKTASPSQIHPGAIADALSTAALVLGFAPCIPATSLGSTPFSGKTPTRHGAAALSSSDSGKIDLSPTYPHWRVYLQCLDDGIASWHTTQAVIPDFEVSRN